MIAFIGLPGSWYILKVMSGLLLNPIISMTILGIVSNLAFHRQLPGLSQWGWSLINIYTKDRFNIYGSLWGLRKCLSKNSQWMISRKKFPIGRFLIKSWIVKDVIKIFSEAFLQFLNPFGNAFTSLAPFTLGVSMVGKLDNIRWVRKV